MFGDAFGTVYTTTANLAATVSGGLIKNGANILTLTGANTYTGPTVVNAGTLALGATGTIANSSQFFVATPNSTFSVAAPTTFAANQSVAGQGIILGNGNALTLNGGVTPGVTAAVGSVGTLTVTTTGALTLGNTAVVAFDILAPGTQDLISTGKGTLTLAGTLNLNLGANLPAGTYTLFSGLAAAATARTTSRSAPGTPTATARW